MVCLCTEKCSCNDYDIFDRLVEMIFGTIEIAIDRFFPCLGIEFVAYGSYFSAAEAVCLV